ncbi:DUF4124 domain-containing protein [Ferrimonas balearica]|uniref:DUF4124 domain-containing protein n=1 Tax=Ferrimonas balearica TaxID=44012 RepID=UPI001C59FDCA|nr:DUF4124 domain-containing protein [Ferrimonas balearica]MBW3141280.1 DUF4124 domain-containing protein [Ferrimonas balearica]MBW3166139.1 DUF4124 domain-containing protein [Ferrimonas balearica]MBY5981945.1 DUF4124 domain-containing protein [Ferrimonas balearica]MBY6108321.1 DUF4124 domain-containing protein [Ferrimonas balearica]MBY6225555.1 DUF4124 domain-containing protein [Ferrimonas balearica]
MGSRYILLVAALLLAPQGFAKVYRWVDSNGQVHYSDKPQDGAEEIAVDTSKANTIELAKPSPTTAPLQPVTAPEYRISLSAPEQDATVRDNNGQLNLNIALQPDLLADHRIELLLNGEVVRTVGSGGSFALDNIDRGEHVLQARVIDENGKVLASSRKTTVYLHRHSRLIAPPKPQPRS